MRLASSAGEREKGGQEKQRESERMWASVGLGFGFILSFGFKVVWVRDRGHTSFGVVLGLDMYDFSRTIRVRVRHVF